MFFFNTQRLFDEARTSSGSKFQLEPMLAEPYIEAKRRSILIDLIGRSFLDHRRSASPYNSNRDQENPRDGRLHGADLAGGPHAANAMALDHARERLTRLPLGLHRSTRALPGTARLTPIAGGRIPLTNHRLLSMALLDFRSRHHAPARPAEMALVFPVEHPVLYGVLVPRTSYRSKSE